MRGIGTVWQVLRAAPCRGRAVHQANEVNLLSKMNEGALLDLEDVKFLVEHPNKKNQTYGQLLLADLRRLFRVIHRRDEYASPDNFQRGLQAARRQLVWDATRRAPLSREAYNLAKRFRENADSYFRFITEPKFWLMLAGLAESIAPSNSATCSAS